MNIRNFVIIAHIDHGKSTLADRLLELTGTVAQRKMREQFLDQMDLERERGITIKMQPVRMIYKIRNPKSEILNNLEIRNSKLEITDSEQEFVLNLIDTPGHVDFTYEVSRALAAVEGAVLLVDATQGIQAQTLANLQLAKKENLKIIGVINKIDLINDLEKLESLKQEIAKLTGQKSEEILAVSAKTGLNAEKVLERIIKDFPTPKIDLAADGKYFRALVFDSHFDVYKGVLAYVKVVEGEISKQKLINALTTGAKIQVLEIGIFKPELAPVEKLSSGEIGYIATGLKNPELIKVGDTLAANPNAEPLPGYSEPKPMVWASFYPESADDFDLLKDALAKLKLNDAALHYESETQEALGRGFRLGFLGMLHLDITAERLRREYNRRVIITTPTVSYRLRSRKGETTEIFTPADWPDPPPLSDKGGGSHIESIEEPWVHLEILVPTKYLGGAMKLMDNYRGSYSHIDYLGLDHLILNFDMPLSDILVDFHDRLKSVSEGYASMNYEFSGFRTGDLVKLQILIAGEPIETFSKIVPKNKAHHEGNLLVKKLKEVIPRQNTAVALQAAIGGKIIARETISAMRKDVTAKLYGGDVTRKMKLLEKQKKGKKKRAAFSRIQLDSDIYLKMFKNVKI